MGSYSERSRKTVTRREVKDPEKVVLDKKPRQQQQYKMSSDLPGDPESVIARDQVSSPCGKARSQHNSRDKWKSGKRLLRN